MTPLLLTIRKARFAAIGLALATTISARAQFSGFGGYGSSYSSRSSRSSSSSSSQKGTPVGVGDAVISVDPETRSLVVIADEDTSRYISEVVSNLDRPKPQVLIKVVFLEVTRNNSSDIGIEGSYTKNIGSSFISGITTNFSMSSSNTIISSIVPARQTPNFTGTSGFGLAGAGSPSGLYQILGQDYQVTLRAIASAGHVKVLSRPSIIARNNQPATITVGQSVPLITDVRFDNFGNAINSVNYQDVGIILQVTPFITADRQVEMILSPETSELVADRSQWVPISSGPNGTVSAPLINSRSADTVVDTPDGQTVIIGGLMENSKAESEDKIPFLGDIPILGNLFKHKVKSDATTELLIFLTPYIIEAPSDLQPVSARERAHSDAARSLTEQELSHFLEDLPQLKTNTPAKGSSHK